MIVTDAVRAGASGLSRALQRMPLSAQKKIAPIADAVEIVSQMRDPRVFAALGPSSVRGLILQEGKQGRPTKMKANHEAHFDWDYPADHPKMRKLYERAKQLQWNGSTDLPWDTDVDPYNPEREILPQTFLNLDGFREFGYRLDKSEKQKLTVDLLRWQLSQFLHGEQGALYAAAQVTEAVQFFDGSLYGATQVMDEARHVEVFHRYLDTKLDKVFEINDNLFVVIDALMTDGRWDMKFLGMQIMVEGLALGAFSTLHKMTNEPLLKELLKRVIQDEARHVHYGVLALREHITTQLTERERREREDWCFEVAILMRNRFMAHEVYDAWFGGTSLRRQDWDHVVLHSTGLSEFRHVMFRRLVPNLRSIGLLTERIMPHYEKVGLLKYMDGRAADQITAEEMLADAA